MAVNGIVREGRVPNMGYGYQNCHDISAKRTMRVWYVILFFVVGPSGWSQDLSGPNKYRLVDIFCTALTEQQSHPEKFTDSEKIWSLLEQNFQEGELFSVLMDTQKRSVEFQKVKTTEIFQNCIEQNRKEFELGEFVLNGLKIVRESLKAYQSKQSLQISSAIFPVSGIDESGPEVQVEISSSNSRIGDLKEVEAVIGREKKYSQLWQQFIQGLKSKSKIGHF